MKSQEEWTAVLEHEPIAANESYEFEETRELVLLVQDAAELIRHKGVAAFDEFRKSGSRWRQEERYIFVLDPDGTMLVHPDSGMEYKNQLQLKDIQGKFIVRGLLDAAMGIEDKIHGWYHYQWPVPGGLLPRWKSSYVERVTTADGKTFVVGSGMYNDRMERAFVVDTVMLAAAVLKKEDRAAFKRFRDPKDAFRFKDAYLFVIDMNGVEWVNPAFPNIEGRKMLDLHDSRGKYLYRDMIQMIQEQGEGWLDYMWPKPGERISTQKSAFVKGVQLGDQTLMVGCGVYLEDAPVEKLREAAINAEELMNHVRDAAKLLETQGEKAYPAFREKGSRWFHDEHYLFVFKTDGTRAFHAAEPESEGRMDIELRDIVGRPIVRMILDVASSPSGEGWVHYMYPEPGDLFPTWKSSFIKQVKFPSGEEHILGCGIYNMQMEPAFIEELVNRAATLIERDGRRAFDQLRDIRGSFVFMDSYVFVQSPEGTELVNPGLPALEGKNLMEQKDLKGRYVIKEQIAAVMKSSPVWVESYWYKPGSNKMALKRSFIRKVEHAGETLLVGAGMYGEEERLKTEG